MSLSIYDIPKCSLRDYVVLDRKKLSKLNLLQKISCAYCGYSNGLTAWFKAVSNRTEAYSCAIKHNSYKKGQEHHVNFYEYDKFT